MTQQSTTDTKSERLAELEKAVGREPASGVAWGRLGLACNDASAHELARQALEDAARLAPSMPCGGTKRNAKDQGA